MSSTKNTLTTELPDRFQAAQPVLAAIIAHGFEAYFVGGAVRDYLLGRPIHDVDIATSAFPEEIKAIFEQTIDTGIAHGTVMVRHDHVSYEITTFRTESTYTDYRRPDHVTFVRSLAADLQRRDFTVNALALTHDNQIIDLYGGQADLIARRLVAVGDPQQRFSEDALRIMRASRFQSQLAMTITADTQAAMAALAGNLSHIAVERITVEFEKMLQGPAAAASVTLAAELGLLQHLPAHELFFSQQAVATLSHDLAVQQPTSAAGVWAYLVCATQQPVANIAQLLRAWKLSKATCQLATAVARFWQAYQTGGVPEMLYFDVYPWRESIQQTLCLLGVSVAAQATIAERFDGLAITHRSQLAIDGQVILATGQVARGPLLGQTLDALLQAVVNHELPNDPEKLLAAVKTRWIKTHD